MLHDRGLRLTPQREMVLSALHEIEGLATADEIYARIWPVSSALDISTVYRTLDLLREFDIVASIDAGDGQRRYELLGLHGPHIHLVCTACDAVTGVAAAEAQDLADRLTAEYGFAPDLGRLSIPGLCAHCAQEAAAGAIARDCPAADS